jgi:hypothetical protein
MHRVSWCLMPVISPALSSGSADPLAPLLSSLLAAWTDSRVSARGAATAFLRAIKTRVLEASVLEAIQRSTRGASCVVGCVGRGGAGMCGPCVL